MLFTANPIGIFAACVELGAQHGILTKRLLVLAHRFFGNFENTDAFDIRCGTRKVLVDKLTRQSHRFKNLRAAITLIGGNTHLRHYLEQPFGDGLDVFFLGFFGIDSRQVILHVVQRFQCEIRMHRRCAVAAEQRKVVHFARTPGLDHEPCGRAQTFFHQMLMHRADREQCRNRDMRGIDLAISNDEQIKP